MTKKEITLKIINNITWSNWELEECDSGYSDKEIKYWSTNAVLFNRIEWIKESLDTNEDSETLDTLEMLEMVLNLVDIDDVAELYSKNEENQIKNK